MPPVIGTACAFSLTTPKAMKPVASTNRVILEKLTFKVGILWIFYCAHLIFVFCPDVVNYSFAFFLGSEASLLRPIQLHFGFCGRLKGISFSARPFTVATGPGLEGVQLL